MNIVGEWHLTGEGIRGYAKDLDCANPIWVELWADDISVGIARADMPEHDGCGFWLPFSPDLIAECKSLRLIAANLNVLIPQKIETEDLQEKSETVLLGEFQLDRGLQVTGWARDADEPERKLHLTAYVEEEPVAETVAGARSYRPIQSDGHAFSLTLPMHLADGQTHVVHIRDDRGRSLPNSPFSIRCLPEKASQYLANAKKIDKPLIDLIGNILDTFEARLPGAYAETDLEGWKKAFPVQAPSARTRASLKIIGASAELIAKQQAGEYRIRHDNPDFLLFADNTQSLHPLALANMTQALRETGAKIAYADGEDTDGKTLFKPAWDREAFLAQDYLGPMLVDAQWAMENGFSENEPIVSQRLALAIKAGEKNAITHVPMLLYAGEAPQHGAEREKAINGWLSAAYPGSTCENGRVIYALASTPKVTLIIPTRDHADLLEKCLHSLAITSWPDYDILIVDNGSTQPAAISLLAEAETKPGICVLRRPGVFNYANLNNEAARLAKGELLCFLNNDTEALHPEWLAEMARLLLMAGDRGGAVGAKLLWPNGLVQHGGVICGVHQLAAHVGNQWLADEPGYMNRNQIAQRYSAVTAACMLTPKKLFLENGGFDGRRFPVAFNDVDYCLRLGELGKNIYWTPHARLAHHESASRGKDQLPSAKARGAREMALFRTRWGHYADPWYNPNLSLSATTDPFTGLAFPPGARTARQEHDI